jgi:hypothetical protein
MSFQLTSSDITLEHRAPYRDWSKDSFRKVDGEPFLKDNTYILRAKCRDRRGRTCGSSLDLNSCITNQNGIMSWYLQGGMGRSCTSAQLIFGTDGTVHLQAGCLDMHDQVITTMLNLSERIGNENGRLVYYK